MKILFFGDSITDMARSREKDGNAFGYGMGYVNSVSSTLKYEDPTKYEIINRGISGNRVVDLYARIKADVWNHNPDLISILIGVNDDQVQDVIDIIAKHSKKRKQMVPNNSFDVDMYSAFPVEVTVGGAIVFVMNVERFEKV